MTETYCGKSCADCAQKEKLNCTGCKNGPGRQFGGDCEIAKCVKGKGHETCGTCLFHGTCSKRSNRDPMPDQRLRRIEAEERKKAALARRAPVLGKWLWIAFWLIIPSSIASLMTQEAIVEAVPALNLPGQMLSLITGVSHGLIYIKLASEDTRYRTAGICYLIGAGVNVLLPLVSESKGSIVWMLVLGIPAAVAGLICAYNECMAHSEVLAGVEDELSEKWSRLWKWEIGCLSAMIGSLLIIFLLPTLGALIVLAGAIGVLVVSILKLVYLYRTAKIFREYSAA